MWRSPATLVLMAPLDAKMVPLHRKTSEIVWETTIEEGESTDAPDLFDRE